MALSSLTYTQTSNYNWQASNNLVGAAYQPISNGSQPAKIIKLGTNAANAAANGSDELYSKITVIAPSGTASIDVTNLTDILNTASVNLARVKAIVVQLLNTTDDATNGTACSSITVDGTVANALLSSSFSGWLNSNTSKIDVAGGDILLWGTTRAAGIVVSGANKIIKFVNNDATNNAAVQLTVVGGST